MKFYAELHGHVKPKEERKRGKKRAAADAELIGPAALQAVDDATAAAQEDSNKKKEAYLSFLKELCGGDGEGNISCSLILSFPKASP